MTKIPMPLRRKFLIIDSPIPFNLINSQNGDTVHREGGNWQIETGKLLDTAIYGDNPVFNLDLVYDETKLKPGEQVIYNSTDLNLGDSLRGVDGQLVTINQDNVVSVKKEFLQDVFYPKHISSNGSFITVDFEVPLDNTLLHFFENIGLVNGINYNLLSGAKMELFKDIIPDVEARIYYLNGDSLDVIKLDVRSFTGEVLDTIKLSNLFFTTSELSTYGISSKTGNYSLNNFDISDSYLIAFHYVPLFSF